MDFPFLIIYSKYFAALGRHPSASKPGGNRNCSLFCGKQPFFEVGAGWVGVRKLMPAGIYGSLCDGICVLRCVCVNK